MAKNLILAGVKGLTLLDHEQVLNTGLYFEHCGLNSGPGLENRVFNSEP